MKTDLSVDFPELELGQHSSEFLRRVAVNSIGFSLFHRYIATAIGALCFSMHGNAAPPAEPRMAVADASAVAKSERALARLKAQPQVNDYIVKRVGDANNDDQKYLLMAPVGWPNKTIHWRYSDTNRPSSLSPTAADSIFRVQYSMARWSAVCGIVFIYDGLATTNSNLALGSGTDGIRAVGWGNLPGNVLGSVLTVTTATNPPVLVESDLALDTDLLPTLGRSYLESTVLHELGHFLGLKHSNVEGAVMSGPNNPPEVSTTYTQSNTLQADDISGCQALYGVATTAAIAAASTSAMSFPDTAADFVSVAQQLTVTNTGTAPLVVDQLSFDSVHFGVSSTTCRNAIVAPGGTCVVNVVFAPLSGGARTGVLSLTHAASTTPIRVTLSGRSTGPGANLTPMPLNFGAVASGSSSTPIVLSITSAGTTPVNVANITSNNAEFAVTSNSCSGVTIAVGQSCAVQVVFTPTSVGLGHVGTLNVVYGNLSSATLIAMSGDGAFFSQPGAALNSQGLSFADTAFGATSSPITVTVTNFGAQLLQVSAITSNLPDFVVTGNTCAGLQLAFLSECSFDTSFSPKSDGTISGVINISNNGAAKTLSATGRGLAGFATYAPAALSFVNTPITVTSAGQNVVLTNRGSTAMTIGAVTVSGAAFGIVSDGCSGITLNPLTACAAVLRFTPATAASLTGTLNVPHNATGPKLIALDGKGAACTVISGLTSVYVGATVNYSATCVNAPAIAWTLNGSTQPSCANASNCAVTFASTGASTLIASPLTGAPVASTASTTISVNAATVPTAPIIGSATAGNALASVSFTAPTSNGGSTVLSYIATCASQSATGATSPITVTGLTNGVSVSCTVKATNGVGTGPASTASNSVTPTVPVTAPGAPIIGTATAGNGQVVVGFTAPASNGGSAITGYTVTCGAQSATGSASPLTVTGLTNGVTVTCTVKASNVVGAGSASAASNSVTPSLPASCAAITGPAAAFTGVFAPSRGART